MLGTMSKQVVGMGLIVLFLGYSFSASVNGACPVSCGGGWVEARDGIQILHVNGSYYAMGYQEGFLLKEALGENYRAFLNYAAKRGYSYARLLSIWADMEPYMPEAYLQELQGEADGSQVSFVNVSILSFGWFVLVNCGSFAAWGNATVDGSLYHARSSDLSLSIQDPVTGRCIQENQVLLVRRPAEGYASVSVSSAGEIGCESGFNAQAVAVGMLSSWSTDETRDGIEIGMRIRMVLDHAATADEALRILTSNRTLGYNCIVSDAKIPMGFAVETNAASYYVGTWNSSSEGTWPFWQIPNVVRRANLYVDPVMAASQRHWYNPSYLPLVSMLLKVNTMSGTTFSASAPWVHYEAISNGVEHHWGTLTLNSTMNVLRNIYLGKTDVRFWIMQKTRQYASVHQWVANPLTGEFVVAFATKNKNAYETPVHYFRLTDLLKENPPVRSAP